MKTAVIYYSYEGSCALVAETVRAELDADIFEIKTKDSKKRSGLVKYAWGGSQVVMGRKPAILPLSVDVDAYDLIVLGTPVWAGSPSPALVSFLDKTKIAGKKVALFCCHAGGKGKVFEKLRALLQGNTVAGEIDFMNPAGGGSAALKEKIGGWVKMLGA